MGETASARLIRVRQRETRRAIGIEFRRARLDAGLSQRAVADAARIHHSHLSRIESGGARASLEALTAVAAIIGSDLSVRLFPSDGPGLRDHAQARMVDAVVSSLHARWRPHLEVPVHRPARGVIDMVLADPVTLETAAAEHHSELRSAEQQLRWAAAKAESLASAAASPFGLATPPDEVSRLLFLRSSAQNRRLVTGLPHLFATAFPGSTQAAYAALTGPAGARLPAAALLWVDVRGSRTRLLAGPPRRVGVGRG